MRRMSAGSSFAYALANERASRSTSLSETGEPGGGTLSPPSGKAAKPIAPAASATARPSNSQRGRLRAR